MSASSCPPPASATSSSRDRELDTSRAYEPARMPSTYLIDKQGRLRATHPGYQPGDEKAIADEIAALVGE